MTGQEFKAIRLRLGVPQSSLADRLGISDSTVCAYETGRHGIPRDIVATMRRLTSSGMCRYQRMRLGDRIGHGRIRETLVACQWSEWFAAKALGVRYTTLWHYVNRHFKDEWLRCKKPR